MDPATFTISLLFGSILGSFINVVVSRGPRAWGMVNAEGRPSGFAWPPSQCESCGARIRPYDLVPIMSFILLSGRCRACGQPIGLRHLGAELLGGGLSVLVVWRYGLSLEAAIALAVLLTLTALAIIDAETGYLPNALTLPLLAGGLLHAGLVPERSLSLAVVGVALGGGVFWLLAAGYRKLRGRHGLGGGDVKLLAAGGAWCGAYALPMIVVIASVSALTMVAARSIATRSPLALSQELRFGPYLATAIGLLFLSGEMLYPR